MIQSTEFLIPNISCAHCVHTIEMELGDLEGVRAITASQETRNVRVEFEDPASAQKIIDLLKEINYPPA